MKTKKFLPFYFCVVFVLIFINAHAQTPESFNYQAVIRNASGAVMPNQNVGLQVSILQGSASGAVVYSETHAVTTNATGMISIKIGEGSVVSGSIAAISWGSNIYFLKLEADVTGGTSYNEIGTMQLASVPYALYAKDVENNDDADADPGNELQTLSLNSGQVSISNGNSVTLPDASATNELQTLSLNTGVVSISNGNSITLPDASATNEIQSLSLSSGVVSISGSNSITLPDASATNELQTLTFANDTLRISSGNAVKMNIPTNQWTSGTGLIYYNGGKVGIGTNAPAHKLHLYESVDNAGGTEGNYLEIQNSNNNTGSLSGIRFQNGTSANTFKGAILYRDTLSWGRGDMLFINDATAVSGNSNINHTRMVIKNNGNVGIGTINPVSKLEVKGDASASPTAPLFQVLNKDGDTVFAVYNDGVQVFIDENAVKGNVGGFAISGRTNNKGVGDLYLKVTPDSTRVYVNQSTKGNVGGFAISGRTNNKATTTNFMDLTPDNYFIGHESGKAITTGTKNTFIGYQAGKSTSSGTANIFIGQESGLNNTYGIRNIFIGLGAGKFNEGVQSSGTIGHDNIYIGTYAGRDIDSGEHNTLIGSYSGYMSSGTKNTFLGAFTGFAASGKANVFLGVDAGRENNAGDNNTFLGTIAGRNNSGSNNTYVGYASGYFNNGTGNVFLGYYAGTNEAGSNRLYICNTNTEPPLIYGEFDNKKLKINGQLQGVDATATSDLPGVYGEHITTVNWGIGVKGVGGYQGLRGESTVAGTGSRYGVVGIGNSGTSSNYGGSFSATGGSTAYGIYASASGASANNYAGYFSGNVYVAGNITATGSITPSDFRLKTNILPITSTLNQIMQINAVTYNWKSESEIEKYLTKPDLGKEKEDFSFNFPETTQYGVIAQELEKVYPDLVVTDGKGVKSVDYMKLIPIMLRAMQEQQELIIKQQSEIEQIKQQLQK